MALLYDVAVAPGDEEEISGVADEEEYGDLSGEKDTAPVREDVEYHPSSKYHHAQGYPDPHDLDIVLHGFFLQGYRAAPEGEHHHEEPQEEPVERRGEEHGEYRHLSELRDMIMK